MERLRLSALSRGRRYAHHGCVSSARGPKLASDRGWSIPPAQDGVAEEVLGSMNSSQAKLDPHRARSSDLRGCSGFAERRPSVLMGPKEL